MWIVGLAFTHGPERLAARKAHREELTERHEEGIVWRAGSLADDHGAVIGFDVPDRSRLAELAVLDLLQHHGCPRRPGSPGEPLPHRDAERRTQGAD